jgi:hypothetical protein
MKLKYRCNECAGEPCTITLKYMDDGRRITLAPDILKRCLVSGNTTADFKEVT